jgi:small Trp-rich protein
MVLLWLGVVLVLLKALEFAPLAEVSWWWILAPLAVAALWFEVLERLVGRDRRQVDAIEWEARRKERVQAQFQDPRRR